ncbi:PIN domain-containing protein [Anabaena sp. PCC 7108]|uniref:PIN domain-containing protein n=1 Tax=Anabaena sp. PCC 7108 TaxID=163908 RepID=UPI000345A03A|nr:PIN domain-containing protein [Anabaena sp. PCC 7108]
MTFLCDTNIISKLVRPQPNPGVLTWVNNLSSINISVITLEEIHYALKSKPNIRIQNWFDNFIKNDCQILPITAEIAKLCGELRGQRSTKVKR